jgi:DNA-binding Lrp family transcriptional regulator
LSSKRSSNTTTTAEITRIRGLSLDILALLQSRGGLYTPEIAEEVGKSKNHVRAYMHNLLNYGCVDRFGRWGWEITAFGVDVLLYNNNDIDKRSIKETSKKHKRCAKDGSGIPHTTHSSRQLNINLFLQQTEDLSENQVVVVVALAEHYEKTGRPYLIVRDYYQFADQVGLDERMDDTEIHDLVISLDVAGMIYRFRDGLDMKIGLLKRVVDNLQYC